MQEEYINLQAHTHTNACKRIKKHTHKIKKQKTHEIKIQLVWKNPQVTNQSIINKLWF